MMDSLQGIPLVDVPPDPAAPDATSPEPATSAAPAPAAAPESAPGCPFHTVMSELAHTAVSQHVLYLEGEVLPQTVLTDALDGWEQLYRLVRTHVCPATRDAALTPADLAVLVNTALPRLLPARVPAEVAARLRQQLDLCARCQSPQQCPLGGAPSAGPVEGGRGAGQG